MSPLLFSNAMLLGGLALLSIPVLIHLLMRRKQQRLRFSSIQFFERQEDRTANRRKLRHWLLLCVRLALIALLVTAFARPYIKEQTPAGDLASGKRVVIILDRSASMQTRDPDGARWTKALRRVADMLGELAETDQVCLVEATAQPSVVISWCPPERLKAALPALAPGFGAADIDKAVEEAVRLLASSDSSSAERRMYLVSDLQKSGFRSASLPPIPSEIQAKVLSVAQGERGNVAVEGINYVWGGAPSIQVELVSYAPVNDSAATLELFVNGATHGSQSVTLCGSGTNRVVFRMPALKPGWHQFQAKLHSMDGFQADDSHYSVLSVPQPIRVLVAESRKTGPEFQAESFFVTSALLAVPQEQQWMTSFAVQVVSPSALADAMKNPGAHDLALVPPLAGMSADGVQGMHRFVSGGGGVVFFCGESLIPVRFNQAFRDLLPGEPGRVEGSLQRPEQVWNLGATDAHAEAFAAFRKEGSVDLTLPEFSRRFAIVPNPSAAIITRFDDGQPMTLVHSYGLGRVILINTSMDTTWTDWPKRKSFLPWLHGIVRQAARRAEVTRTVDSAVVIAGDAVELDLPRDERLVAVTAAFPDGRSAQFQVGKSHRVSFPSDVPGVYELKDKEGHPLCAIPVNTPREESVPVTQTTDQVEARLANAQTAQAAGIGMAVFDQHQDEKHFWRILLAVGGILLLLELGLANRTYS